MGNINLSLVASILFHGAIIYIAATGLPLFKREFPTPPRPVSVELITVDEMRRLKEEPKPAPREEQKAAPARKVVQPQAENAVPLPNVQPKTKPDPELIKRKILAQQATPHTKPRPPSNFDSSKIAALIDRSIKEKPQEAEPVDREKILEEAVESSRALDMNARIMTASIEDYVRQKMRECWSVPSGAKSAEDLVVVLMVRLNPEGYLIGPPRIVDRARMFQPGNEYFRIAAESASRAVRLCEPYDLPKEHYNLWQELELKFDPREMLG